MCLTAALAKIRQTNADCVCTISVFAFIYFPKLLYYKGSVSFPVHLCYRGNQSQLLGPIFPRLDIQASLSLLIRFLLIGLPVYHFHVSNNQVTHTIDQLAYISLHLSVASKCTN